MDLRLPKLGEGAESGTVVSIMVKEGDTISEGQTILELENEKAVAAIPSTASGKITSLRVKEGDKISVGQVIATLEQGAGAKPDRTEAKAAKVKAPDGEAAKPAEAVPRTEPEPEPAAPPVPGVPPSASPSIRRMARELGIDLTQIRGSERGGRIVLADVRAYIQRLQQLAKSPQAPKAQLPRAEQIDFAKWGPVTRKPASSLRKVIAQRMTESWTTIPHVTQFDEADITALNEMRKQSAPAYEQRGARLTLTTFVLKAVVAILKKHPLLNASFDAATEEIIFKDYYHIGLAVDTEQGLIVPVIRDVDKKDMVQLSKEMNDLAEKARSRKVALDELKGGTFTISNQGGIGGGQFTPIINKPEAAILGLGRGALKAVVVNQQIETRLMLPLGLSYDHRLIDGANAARFMVDLVNFLEHFPPDGVKLT